MNVARRCITSNRMQVSTLALIICFALFFCAGVMLAIRWPLMAAGTTYPSSIAVMVQPELERRALSVSE